MAQPMSTPNPAGGSFQQINTTTTLGAMAASGGGQLPSVTPPVQMTSPTKEVNAASLCRTGQEMVQDIVQKTSEIFKDLKATHLPNGTNMTPQLFQDRKVKLEEHIRNVNGSFRKLLVIYEKVKEYKEDKPIEEYLPIQETGGVQGERPRISDNVMYISEEHKEIIEEIQLKNQQLKEIIDHLRLVIWEINTMMAVKRKL